MGRKLLSWSVLYMIFFGALCSLNATPEPPQDEIIVEVTPLTPTLQEETISEPPRLTLPPPKETNQQLTYRILNSNNALDPSDIVYYRRWKKQLQLEWLAHHKNLMIPGMMGPEDDEIY